MIKNNNLLTLNRLEKHQDQYPEIKDPSVVKIADDQYMMYASVGRSSDQTWIVGRFVASHPAGPWTEVDPVNFVGLNGPQLCAPAVLYNEGIWTMYIQTACFEENGVIAVATSTDGQTFSGVTASVISRDNVEKTQHPVVGVYDAGISEVNVDGEDRLVMLFSGYRRVGCGDLYMSYKKKAAPESDWSQARLVLAQEDVSFHNNPSNEHFEWGLEGAKIIQVNETCFLLIGVCFLPMENALGQRQRVFFATSSSMFGPFLPLGVPFQPQENEWKTGEHGHPDTLILGNDLFVIYQERKGDGKPWHLRYATMDLSQFSAYAMQTLLMTPPEMNQPHYSHL